MMRHFSRETCRTATLVAVLATLFLVPVAADMVITTSGDQIAGRIIAEDYNTVTLRSSAGELVFQRSEITEIRRSFTGESDLINPLPVDPASAIPSPGVYIPDEVQPLSPPPEVAQGPSEPQGEATGQEATDTEEPTGEEIPPTLEPGSAGVVFMLDGGLQVRRRGQWMEAELGMQLRVSDHLQTGEGRCKVLLRGRGEVRLPPNSHLELVAIDEEGANVTLNLVRGSVWVEVEPPETGGLNFNVQTPELTAGVRGTLFNVTRQPATAERQAGTRLSVFAGVVQAISVIDTSQTAMVTENMWVFCGEDGRLTAPQPITYDLEREWREWDEWALEAHGGLAVPFAAGGDAISGLIQTTAAEQQLHATMVAEHAANTNLNRQGEFLAALTDGFVQYARDVRDLPPSAEPQGADGWRALVEDPGTAGWRGPYLPGLGPADVPVVDGWGNPITYRRQQSQVSGNVYGELISNGPNGIFSSGQTDDLRQLIVLPADVQAELQARSRP